MRIREEQETNSHPSTPSPTHPFPSPDHTSLHTTRASLRRSLPPVTIDTLSRPHFTRWRALPSPYHLPDAEPRCAGGIYISGAKMIRKVWPSLALPDAPARSRVSATVNKRGHLLIAFAGRNKSAENSKGGQEKERRA